MRVFMIVSFCLLVGANALGATPPFKCPPVPKQEAVALKKAGRYFAAGEKLAINGAYRKSLERYLCSLKMKEHPNTMFNIAQVAKLIENKGPILQLLKKFRNRNPEHPSVPEINRLIEKMEKGDYESINPQSPTEEPVVEKEPEIVAPVKDTEPPADLAMRNTGPSADELRHRKRLKTAGIIFIAGGTVFTGLGIGFGVASSAAKSDASAAMTYDNYDFYNQRHKAFAGVAITSFILGAASLTTGIILLVRAKKATKSQVTIPAPVVFMGTGPGVLISF